MKPLRDFESAPPHKEAVGKVLNINGLSFIQNYCAKSVSMENVNYKGLKLVKGKRWYVEYYYLIPEGLRHLFANNDYKRFRIFEDINRRKGEEKEAYGQLLLKSIKYAFDEENYNPFESHESIFIKKIGKSLTIINAIDFFQENIRERGLEHDTILRYLNVSNHLKDYLISLGKQDVAPTEIDENVIIDCLQYYRKKHNWGNRNYNSYISFLSIMFNFLKEKKKIEHNPCENIRKLKTIATKHRYYDDKTLKLVLDELKQSSPQLYLAAQFVYYAGVRSSKELVKLKIGDLLPDRDRIMFRGAAVKGKRDDYILLDPKLKDAILNYKLKEYPEEYFIFGITGKPCPKMASDDFFQKKFRAIRKKLGLGMDYTLYSFKHTRAVHLLMDGAEPVDIMQLFRHNDLTTTTKYIRDLGFGLSPKFTERSRLL